MRKTLGGPIWRIPCLSVAWMSWTNRLFVGYSPAAIVSIDLETGEMIDGYQHSTDVRECVHGLRVNQRGT